MNVIREGYDIYLPILWAVGILTLAEIVWLILLRIYESQTCRRYIMRFVLYTMESNQDLSSNTVVFTPLNDDDTSVDSATVELRRSRRLKSLDTFRGLSVTIMIFVNYGGGGYWFFNHSPWNGLTLADVVFPWFMWIMGFSLVISIQSQLRNSVDRKTLLRKTILRSVSMILIGLVLNSSEKRNDISKLRIPGVLQRLGIAYLINGILESFSMQRENLIPSDLWWSPIKDVITNRIQWLIMILILAIHTAITFGLPVPGCPTGYLGPGGLHEGGKFYNCTGGSAGYLDLLLFGTRHLYPSPTSKRIYSSVIPYDPEGALGSLTGIFMTFLGCQAGKILLSFPRHRCRIIRWSIWCLLWGLLASGLCGFSKETGWIPINKNLWSLSFVVGTGSLSFGVMTLLYLWIDVYKYWNGGPFRYAGLNPILLYIGHEVFQEYLPFTWSPYSNTHSERLLMNIIGANVWLIVAYLCYKKRVFISL